MQRIQSEVPLAHAQQSGAVLPLHCPIRPAVAVALDGRMLSVICKSSKNFEHLSLNMQRNQSPSPPPAQAQQSGAVVPSPAPQSPQAGSGGGRPGWQIAVIVIAVVLGVFLAVNAVLIPVMLVSNVLHAFLHAGMWTSQADFALAYNALSGVQC